MNSLLRRLSEKAGFRYLAPFLVFMLLTECQRMGSETSVFWIYAAKTVITGGVLWLCFRGRGREIAGGFDGRAVLLGLAVLAIWVLPPLVLGRKDEPVFDPSVFSSAALRWTAIGFRIAGAVLIVPLMEELIWRSFLMRYLIRNDFLSVPLGQYTPLSFWGTVAAFTLVHRPWEWPMAALTGVLYGFYLVRTRNLRGCIWAHAVTNLGLAVLVLATGKWYFW